MFIVMLRKIITAPEEPNVTDGLTHCAPLERDRRSVRLAINIWSLRDPSNTLLTHSHVCASSPCYRKITPPSGSTLK